MTAASAALSRANEIPALSLGHLPTPIEELKRLQEEIGGGVRLLAKRDDAIPFGFGGNKVRKLSIVVAQAIADGVDTLITVGGIQSNHARATAATVVDRKRRRVVAVADARNSSIAFRERDRDC